MEHSWGENVESLLPRFDLVVACDVMYIAESVSHLVKTLSLTCSATGHVLVAHGRNRNGEGIFMHQVSS